MNDFMPNSFQVPNAYIDQFWHLLTSDEKAVLMYMARRIFGFNKRQDHISLSQLSHGITTKDGKRLDHGTGLKDGGNRTALAGLTRYNFVIELAPPDFGKRIAALYALQMDSEQIDKEGLEIRAMTRSDNQKQRTAIARITKELSIGVCATTPGAGSVGQHHNNQSVPNNKKSTGTYSTTIRETDNFEDSGYIDSALFPAEFARQQVKA